MIKTLLFIFFVSLFLYAAVSFYREDKRICYQEVHGQIVRYHWLNGCQIQWGDGTWHDLSVLAGGE